MIQTTPRSAVNWNRLDDTFSKMFWDQNVRQFWVDEEIPLADDKLSYLTLSTNERRTYEQALAGLTLLDTEQGGTGMPCLSQAVHSHHAKAVLGFMGAMEHMHAKSYSSIFSTLCTTERIDELFTWVQQDTALQSKIALVRGYYQAIKDPQSLYLAMCASVMLESYLFYSGFFYPLYLAGQGKLVNSGEIINLIIRDESVHGVYVGMLAQEQAKQFSSAEQRILQQKATDLMRQLHDLELHYTHNLYDPLGLTEQVLQFVRYNADKALMNLGLEPIFEIDATQVNPIVLAGLRTETKNHDFFSTKGNGYIKSSKIESLQDQDFVFA